VEKINNLQNIRILGKRDVVANFRNTMHVVSIVDKISKSLKND
jgi:hypothetical protein